eukprot:Skav219272  [mRNA]  locus=scaffold1380:128644:137057:- [translate_table: standard]
MVALVAADGKGPSLPAALVRALVILALGEERCLMFDQQAAPVLLMRLSVATEVVDNTQSKVHCLRFGSGNDDLQMKLQDSCGSTMTAEFHGVTESSSRLVKFTEGSNQCRMPLRVPVSEIGAVLLLPLLRSLPIGIHSNCLASATAQQIPMADLPSMLRIHTKDHEEAGHRLRPSLIDCWGRGAIGKVDMMHLFNTNRAQTAAYVGRVVVPGSATAHGTSSWQRLSTEGYGFAKADYPAATETRLCVTYSDSGTDTSSGLWMRLRRTDPSGGTVYFSDSFGITWSNTGLYHHVCGPWHDISTISCGYGWSTTCQVDWWHDAYMSIQLVELEFGSSNPDDARFYRGRMELPASRSWTPTANTWTTVGDWFYLGFNKYDANFYRYCVAYTDSSSGGTLYVRMRNADGTTYFQDNLGGTWSNSGLTHAECGAWHSLTNVYCGSSWSNSCDVTSTKTAFLGRMSLDVAVDTTATSNWFKVNSATGVYINTDDYPTATDLRACIVFTDSSTGGGTVKVRLRRTDAAGGTVFFEDRAGPGQC